MTDQPAPDDSLPAVISRAVSAAGYWLPGPGCDAAAQAMAGEIDTARRRAVALVERIDAGRAWARRNLTAEQQAGLFGALRGDATPHVCRPGASLYYCPTSGRTESDCHGGHDVCCDRPDLHQLACGHCAGTGADPEDPGDYDPTVHQHNPGTRGPCPECIQKGLPPRLDLAPADHCLDNLALTAAVGYPVRCPHCDTTVPPTHWTKHVQRHHPDATGLGGDKISLRKADVDLAAAQASRNRWRRDYAELAARHKRALAEHDSTRDRVRKIHNRYADGTCFADGEPYPCPTITALEPPQQPAA